MTPDAQDVAGVAAFDPSCFHMRETKHLNGGKDWFGYEHQCVEEPRLCRLDRYTRKDRSVASTWRVDGENCASFEDAVALLEYSPTLTLIELGTLAKFRAGQMAKAEFGEFEAVYPVLRSLNAKGLIWWESGKVSLRADAALTAIGATESNASGRPSWDAVYPATTAARIAALAVRQYLKDQSNDPAE